MKKILAFFTIIPILFALSCTKMETNSDLVKKVEYWIDMSQSNKCDQSKFVGDWVLTKVDYEVYVDGELTETTDITSHWGAMEYSFNSDGTMYYGTKGRWTYSYNFLIWEVWGGLYSYEVVDVSETKLVYKGEDYFLGGTKPPFYHDKSGRHCFDVFEYTRK